MLGPFIQSLPKTETHLHIEGALPYELLHQWQPEKFPSPPFFHAEEFRFADFSKFDEILLGHALPWFTSADRYHEAAKIVFERHVAQNVRYVETSFHLPVTQFIQVPGKEIIAAIRAAAPPNLELRVFAGMLRTDYVGVMRTVIDELVEWEELDGVDLHGYERTPTEAWSAGVWRKLREAGKVTKVHAGEFDGPTRVREAIEILGSDRIQHGVRAVEDEDVLRLARVREVTFDVCPISNVRLGVAASIREHPLRKILAAGIRCTISTDDPLVFGNSLTQEYEVLAKEGDFSAHELARLARHGFEVASISREAKQRVFEEIDRALSRVRKPDSLTGE